MLSECHFSLPASCAVGPCGPAERHSSRQPRLAAPDASSRAAAEPSTRVLLLLVCARWCRVAWCVSAVCPPPKMTGDKVEVHHEPSSILSDGQRGDDSNGTAQSHSQSTQANNNGQHGQGGHNCKNNWWSCCCCCCSCLSVESSDKSNKEKVQLSSIENYFNGDNEPPPDLEEIRSWGESFDKLMKCKMGRSVFRDFLKCEYSEENILFWLACEDLKKASTPEMVEEKARYIYEEFISILSPREVSLDSRVREIINRNMIEPMPNTFDEAQVQIYTLMHRDSYPRFINSPAYKKLAQLPTSSRKGSAA